VVEMKKLFEEGSSAGKLYTLTALQQKDENELREVLQGFNFSKYSSPVVIQNGGVGSAVSFVDGIRYVIKPQFWKYLPKPKGDKSKNE